MAAHSNVFMIGTSALGHDVCSHSEIKMVFTLLFSKFKSHFYEVNWNSNIKMSQEVFELSCTPIQGSFFSFTRICLLCLPFTYYEQNHIVYLFTLVFLFSLSIHTLRQYLSVVGFLFFDCHMAILQYVYQLTNSYTLWCFEFYSVMNKVVMNIKVHIFISLRNEPAWLHGCQSVFSSGAPCSRTFFGSPAPK